MLLEAAAGYAMLKSAIDGVKSAIETGKDAHGIAKLVGSIFNAQDQINKEKNHSVTIKDQLGMENIVSQEIDSRILEEQLTEIRSLCNMRFGSTFWSDCIAARNKAIAEQKEKDKKIKIRKAQEAKELRQNLFTLIGIVVAAGLIFFAFALYQRAFAEGYTYKPKDYSLSQKIHRGDKEKLIFTTCRLFAQDLKEEGATRWCFYHTRVGFKRLYSTITQDSVVKCQRQFKCIVGKLTDSPPKEVNDTMKNLNKGFK